MARRWVGVPLAAAGLGISAVAGVVYSDLLGATDVILVDGGFLSLRLPGSGRIVHTPLAMQGAYETLRRMAPLATVLGGALVVGTLVHWRQTFRIAVRGWPGGMQGLVALLFLVCGSAAFLPFGDQGGGLAVYFVLGSVGLAVLLWGLWLSGAEEPLGGAAERLGASLVDESRDGARVAWTLALAALGGAVLVALAVFEGVPHVVDGVAQLFQGRIFTSGRFFLPSHPLSEFFDLDTVVNNGRVFSQYPPGHTVLLMLGDLLGAPWLVGPVLGAATVPALYALGKETYGESTGRLAALLLLLSPFFLLMSGEFYNHTSSFLFLTLFLLQYVRFTESPGRRTAIAAGAWLGLALLSRPLTALAVSVPSALHTLLMSLRERDTRRWQAVGLGTATTLVFVGLLLLYNRHTTGAFLSFGYGQAVGPGFGWSEGIDWMRSLSRVIAMNNDLLGWALPGLALPLFVFLRPKVEPWDYLFAAVFFALLLAYLPTGYPDREFGPRYLYESIGALLLLSARALLTIHEGLERLAGRPLERDRVRRNAGAALGVTFLLTFILAWPPRLQFYDSPQWRWAYRDDAVTSVRSQGIENALVFVEGERIWASTFLANRLDFDTASVIFARNLGERNVELMRHYPGRSYFLADSTGLEPLRPD